MRSNCPRCGSPLTIKESIQNWCNSCNHSTAKRPIDLIHSCVSLSRLSRNFDSLIAAELRKSSLTRLAQTPQSAT
jgi:hypothetical protein